MMFTEDDWFSFHKEIMDVVDTFIEEYRARRGEFDNELEKGLVVSFALGALKVDLDEIWEALSNAPIFEGISPKELFERGDYKGLQRVLARKEKVLSRFCPPGEINRLAGEAKSSTAGDRGHTEQLFGELVDELDFFAAREAASVEKTTC